MKKLRITIGKKTYDVTVEVLSDDSPQQTRAVLGKPAVAMTAPPATPQSAAAPPAPSQTVAGAIYSPMAGLVKSIAVKVGDEVKANQLVVVLDAMKMENQIMAPSAGTVAGIEAKEGQSVQEGELLLVLE